MGKTFISEGKSSSDYLIYTHSPVEKNVFSAGYGDSYSLNDCGCSRVDPASCCTVDVLGCSLCRVHVCVSPVADCSACVTT